jgi:hypothetical protein
MPSNRGRRLELGEDIQLERRQFVLQRIGWGLMAVFLVLALLGFFGSGPVSRAIARSEGGAITIEYDRFIRRESAAYVRARVREGERIRVDRAYLEYADLERIDPQPLSARSEPSAIEYVFADSPRPLSVEFRFFVKNHAGIATGTFGALGETVAVRQLIYP